MRWAELDGVVHVTGRCCAFRRCACGATLHMTGGYMGPLYLCENDACPIHPPEPGEWQPGEPPPDPDE